MKVDHLNTSMMNTSNFNGYDYSLFYGSIEIEERQIKIFISDKQPLLLIPFVFLNINANTFFITIYTLAIIVLVLAASGRSLGLREMYVKGLLKVFEYATNIKKEKLNKYEELIPIDITNENAKQKYCKKIHRLRQESFVLHSEEELKELVNYDIDENENVKDIKNLNQNEEKKDEKEDSDEDIEKKYRSITDIKRDFQLGDIIDFVYKGIDTIIDDDVTKRFTTEELAVWNLLTRTNQQYEYVSFRVTVLWFLGFLLRYCILFPFRLVLFVFACIYTLVSTYAIGLLPDGRIKRWSNRTGMQVLHRILSRVFSAIIRTHNKENRAQPGSICVANHTSPIDVIILSTDNTYSLIGQQHGGFTGMMQTAFSRASNHIWFDRTESKDRSLVSKRMREHVKNKENCPILIFPEGTCINNTSVMMFKKGCFEIGATIYPVAIKYDPRFGDAFWNSQKHSMLQYLILMMTSWAIVVDVYYLPPMERKPDEDVMDFTNRVKSEIVKSGSFADLNWDGMLKRDTPKLDLMFMQQKQYVDTLKLD